MRIGIAGPRTWKSLQKRNPSRTNLAKRWLSAMLDSAVIEGPVTGVTSLQLGLDTSFAALCESKGIPYKVILCSKEQDKFWDEEARNIFSHLVQKADSIEYITDEEYKEGTINRQSKAITNWLKEEDSQLLVVKNKTLTKGQIDRRETLKKTSRIKTYRM